MNYKIKKIFTNVRVLIALIAIILAVIAIHPLPNIEGVAIRNIEPNSSANIAGIANPAPNAPPTSRERVLSINNKPVKSLSEYYDQVSELKLNQSYVIRTSLNKDGYVVLTKPEIEIIVLNETEEKNVSEIIEKTLENGTIVSETINKTITVNKTINNVIGVQDLGLNLMDPAKTNIRKGLDLQGGTRVLLQPEEKISEEDISTLIDNMKERLNVFGLTDVIVKEASDLSGNQFVLVEVAGANEAEVKELLSKQGKFEAKIGEEVVFIGGNRDVTYVCRSADCSGIDPRSGCGSTGNGYACGFYFTITLSPEAAQKQADITNKLDVVVENGREYLSESLTLYLDDVEVDKLRIGADLKGNPATNIQISGSGFGLTQQEGVVNSLEDMKKLQTVLITGSLPVKMNIVKTDLISPSLGKEFLKNAYLIGALAILSVVTIVFIRYRRLAVSIPMMLTMITEVVVLLGMASLIGWNIDLAAIAGIIIAVGTGVDDQIVIADETLSGQKGTVYDWKKRLKNAFFIIFAAYFTTIVAMLPLVFAGAGLLKGFALTTILGVSIGVFISRPAFAALVEILVKE
ncbi:MAG: hypothetical protein ABII01_01445 [Candidatus Woesearchaeota archaeon]